MQYFEVCYLPNKACLKIEQLVKSTKYIAIISFLRNMKYKANKSIIKEQHKLICHTNLFCNLHILRTWIWKMFLLIWKHYAMHTMSSIQIKCIELYFKMYTNFVYVQYKVLNPVLSRIRVIEFCDDELLFYISH